MKSSKAWLRPTPSRKWQGILGKTKKNDVNLSNYGNGFEQNNDEQRRADGSRVVEGTTPKMGGAINRGDIRVLEQGLDATYGAYIYDSERTRRDKESERLVAKVCSQPTN